MTVAICGLLKVVQRICGGDLWILLLLALGDYFVSRSRSTVKPGKPAISGPSYLRLYWSSSGSISQELAQMPLLWLFNGRDS
jgi:hypothetical protein